MQKFFVQISIVRAAVPDDGDAAEQVITTVKKFFETEREAIDFIGGKYGSTPDKKKFHAQLVTLDDSRVKNFDNIFIEKKMKKHIVSNETSPKVN